MPIYLGKSMCGKRATAKSRIEIRSPGGKNLMDKDSFSKIWDEAVEEVRKTDPIRRGLKHNFSSIEELKKRA